MASAITPFETSLRYVLIILSERIGSFRHQTKGPDASSVMRIRPLFSKVTKQAIVQFIAFYIDERHCALEQTDIALFMKDITVAPCLDGP